jgi:hypothetical protein
MRFSAFFLAACIAQVLAEPIPARGHADPVHRTLSPRAPLRRTCGSETIPAGSLLDNSRVSALQPVRTSITVKVWFHVVQANSTVGHIPAPMLAKQMHVINKQFAASGFKFKRVGGTKTINPFWHYNGIDSNEISLVMRTALRRGSYKTLNVYFLGSDVGILGKAAFPVANPTAEEKMFDGVVIDWNTVPGGAFAPYNEGVTLTRG